MCLPSGLDSKQTLPNPFRKREGSLERTVTAFDSILLVGCGNMAGAMLRGWLAGGVPAERFVVIDPAARALPAGVHSLSAVPDDARFDAILLGVKPQMLGDVAPQVEPAAGPATTVISILAGVELAVLAARFPRAGGFLRVMPNLAAALGKAPMGVAERGLDSAGRAQAMALLAPLGTPEWIDEGEFDLVTALAGSGPAFVYRFIDALSAGASALGLAEDKARRLALATVDGAAALAASSDYDPAELARRVASPGGVTQAGLDALDQDDSLRRLIQATLCAARDRGAEMAREARRED
jgi:pyrroline-5-carboxylate reductase